MVRAKGKAAAGASTKRSASNKDAAAAATATVASKAAPSTNDSSETAGGSVETVVTEQTVTEQITITAAAEEENDGAEPETLDEELDTEEDDDNDAELETLDGEQMVEENDGVDPETLNEEYTMEEDEENEVAEGEDEENEVVEGEDEENEMVDGDEKDGADEKEEDAPQKKKEEDAIGSGEANNQETAMEQEGSKQQIDDKQVEAAAGTVKDKQENTEDKTSAEAAEGSGKPKAKRMRKRNKWNNKRRKVEPMKGENKQGMDKVASNGKVKDSNNLDSKVDNEQSSKKVASVAAQDMDTKGKDKPEPSQKKSTPKKKKKEKANGMGMIFMCNSETKKDCYRYKVLGLPASKKEMVDKIYKGMRLFLYDVDLKLLYGIYKAVGRGGHNIEPKAFKSQYPSQVRFAILEDCLPLAEETFRKVIKENYYTKAKFDCKLSPEQVRDLCKLFTSKSKGSRSKGARRAFDQTHVISKQDRTKSRRGRVEQRRPERAPRRAGRIEEPRRYPERIEEPRVVYHQLVDEPHGYRERVEERVYHDLPRLHERSLVISPVVPLAPPGPVQSYVDRTLAYRTLDYPSRQTRFVELPDPYRRDPVPDAYRRQAVVEPLDYHRREVLPPPVRREYHRPLNLESRLQDGVGITDPYVSYRERLPYQDSVVRSQPEYNPSAGLRAAYRHAGPSAEFSSTRGMLEYPSSAAGSLYEYPRYR